MTTIMGWSDGGSACEYYRLRVPLIHMLANDPSLQVKIGGMFQTFGGKLPDVVIGQRVSGDGPTEMWRRLAAGELGKRPRLVYEIDDDLFNVPAHNPASVVFNQPTIQRNIRYCMQLADVITVSTTSLGKQVGREINRFATDRIRVIRNALPDIAYRGDVKCFQLHTGTTVGWAGSATHSDDFDEVAEPLARFLRRNPAARYLAIGAMFPDLRKKIPAEQRQLKRWIPSMSEYYAALDAFDIGIIPLKPSVFNQSKSDIKFLEYAARRIPIIASDCGPYEQHAGRAMLANQSYEWLGYLSTAKGYDVEPAYTYAEKRSVKSTAGQWRSAVLGE